MPKLTPIQRARKTIGGTGALAELLGVKPPTVSEWCSGKRPVPEKHCPTIERATRAKGATVTCEELCSGVDWGYIRGTQKAAAGAHKAVL